MLGLSPKAKSQCRKPYLSEELESLQCAGTCSVMAAPALGAPSPCYFCDRHFTEAHSPKVTPPMSGPRCDWGFHVLVVPGPRDRHGEVSPFP